MNEILETEDDINSMIVCELVDGKYNGVRYTYGKITVDETGEECMLGFEYNVLTPDLILDEDIDDFKKYIGDHLLEKLEYQLTHNILTYSGGV